MHSKKYLLVLGLILLAIAGVPVAGAQTTQSSGLALEEIIVKAQKRDENLQNIPVSVSVLDADHISKLGIVNSVDIVKSVPSLTVDNFHSSSMSSFSIRGIGTTALTIAVEQSVAYVVDDVASVGRGQALQNLVDIQSIEVLRGPQSTLFGKSASAGAILVTTKDPSTELEGHLEGTYTDDEEFIGKASISAPITDTLAFRLSGFWRDWDGNVDNLTTGETINGAETYGLRGKLGWDISENVSAMLTAHYYDDDSGCCVPPFLALDPEAKLFGFVPGEPIAGINPGDENDKVRLDYGWNPFSEETGVSLRIQASVGEFDLLSITSVNEWEYENDHDIDFSDTDIVGFATGGAGSGGLTQLTQYDTDFFSQEFRLLSPDYDNLSYLVGLYYSDYDSEVFQDSFFLVQSVTFTGATNNQTAALFTNLTWNFLENTALTGGLRYHREEVEAEYQDLITPGAPILGHDDSDDTVTGKLALQHFLSEDVMLFLSYATGYKGIAYNLSASTTASELEDSVDPEESESIELGIKSHLWDRRVLLNATVFWAEYEDYQEQSSVISVDVEGGGAALESVLENVGTLETSGVELETTFLLTEGLKLSLNGVYMDATVKEFRNADCYPGQTAEQGCIGGTQDIRNGDLPIAPDWKYSVVLDYQHEFESLPFNGFAVFDYFWQDDVIFAITQDPLEVQSDYGIANLRLGLTDKRDRYQVSFFVNNLFDETYTAGTWNAAVMFAGREAVLGSVPRNSQRYAGVTAILNF